LFEQISSFILSHSTILSTLAHAIASLDIYSSLALLAQEHNYTRPMFVKQQSTTSPVLRIVAGRHPVVEARMRIRSQLSQKQLETNQPQHSENSQHSSSNLTTGLGGDTSTVVLPQRKQPQPHFDYTPNDCILEGDESIWLLSGPNMSGKSSFLRQTALITLMAQIGSFVPAQTCILSPVDAIYSRVGASDDISRDLSTFLVEMKETSAILSYATSNSLLIIDELGRGTSTFDGLSIALAVLEDIHNRVQARCIFATHYHELSVATSYLSKMKCYRMLTEEDYQQPQTSTNSSSSTSAPSSIDLTNKHKSLTFFHKVVPGTISSSYGIQVARMAGIPEHVANRASIILNSLEHGQHNYHSFVANVICKS
jgi:DNA mismatch repair protein MutS